MPAPAERSDSLYKQQLAQGYYQLRFCPELEPAFRRHFRKYMRNHQRLGAVGLVLAVLGSIVLHLAVFRPPDPAFTVFTALMACLAALLVLYIWVIGRSGFTWHVDAFVLFTTAFGASAFAVVTWAFAEAGARYPYESFMFAAAYVFLLAGLRFKLALLTGLALGGALCLVLLGTGATHSELASALYNYGVVALIACTGCYLQEFTTRTSFLLNHLAQFQISHDPLTGLLNRRGFMDHLDIGWRQAQRELIPVSAAVFDIDNFKRLNDTHGHSVGDECLRMVAERIDATGGNRPLDFLARTGGEEFVMVLVGAPLEYATGVAESVRTAIEAERVQAGPHTLQITVSGGVATADPRTARDALELVRQADAAMYTAKRRGRNQIFAVDPDAAAELLETLPGERHFSSLANSPAMS